MSETPQDDPLSVPDLPTPADVGLPGPDHAGHGKTPSISDDDLALAAARERVEVGIADYVPDDVPDATDPLPEGSSEEADLAQRGLVEEIVVDDGA